MDYQVGQLIDRPVSLQQDQEMLTVVGWTSRKDGLVDVRRGQRTKVLGKSIREVF